MIKILLLFLTCAVTLSSPTEPAVATQQDSAPSEEPTPAPAQTSAPAQTPAAAPAYGQFYSNNNYLPSVNRGSAYSYPAYNYQNAPLASPIQGASRGVVPQPFQQQPALLQQAAGVPSMVNHNSMNQAVYPYGTYNTYNAYNPFSQYSAWSTRANPNGTSVPVNQPVMNQQAHLNYTPMNYRNNAPLSQYNYNPTYNPTYNAPLNFQSSASQPIQYASQIQTLSNPYFSFGQPSMPLAQPVQQTYLRNVYGNPADPIFDYQHPVFDYQPMRAPFQALPTFSYGMVAGTTQATQYSEQQPAAKAVDATSSTAEATSEASSIPKYVPYSLPRTQAYNFIPYTAPNYNPYSYNSFGASATFAAGAGPAAQVAVAPTVQAAPGASV